MCSSDLFDLVFLDPPFDAGLYGASLEALVHPGLLAPAARIYIESDARSPSPITVQDSVGCASAPCLAANFEAKTHWLPIREKRIGDVRMQLLAYPVTHSVTLGESESA